MQSKPTKIHRLSSMLTDVKIKTVPVTEYGGPNACEDIEAPN
jgi:hypothetical protein